METDLRILLVEDIPSDAELIEREIDKAGILLTYSALRQSQEFLDSLQEFCPDVILSDFHLRSFNGMEALALAREKTPQTPFIMVTEPLGEETAVECMKAGAWDYVLKGRLVRLAPTIHAALVDKSEQYETEEVLYKLSRAMEQSTSAILITDTKGTIEYANESYSKMTGYALENIIGTNSLTSRYDDEVPDIFGEYWEIIQTEGKWCGERLNKKRGEDHTGNLPLSPR